MTSNLERRIILLEAGAAVQARANHVVHQIIVGVGEDEDAAVARFAAEHPEMDLREPAPGEHLPIGLIVRKITGEEGISRIMTNLTRRVAELEKAACLASPPERWKVVAALDEGEPQAQTIARWQAEHPDDPSPANFIILVPVAPPADLGNRRVVP